MLRFNLISIFPDMFRLLSEFSLFKRAIANKIIKFVIYDLRDYTKDKHKTTDDYPFGGGSGMVMKVEPFYNVLNKIKTEDSSTKLILMSPQGERLTDSMARDLSKSDSLTILSGRYEGVDERVCMLVDRQISIGDYILTGGEIAAMVLIEAVARFRDNFLGDEQSSTQESFSDRLLEHPQYTRPSEFLGMNVPEVLLSGDHEKIRRWRRLESVIRTALLRPDLILSADLEDEEKALVYKILSEDE